LSFDAVLVSIGTMLGSSLSPIIEADPDHFSPRDRSGDALSRPVEWARDSSVGGEAAFRIHLQPDHPIAKQSCNDVQVRRVHEALLTIEELEAMASEYTSENAYNPVTTTTSNAASYTAGRTINQTVNIYTTAIAGTDKILTFRELSLLIRDEIYAAEALGA
jgi:hypothetical protein